MSESIVIFAGMVLSAGLVIFVAAFIAKILLKNIYISVLVGYGCLLLVRSLLGGVQFLPADIIAVAVVLLIFWLLEKKRRT